MFQKNNRYVLNGASEIYYIENDFPYQFYGNEVAINANIDSFVKNKSSNTGYGVDFFYNKVSASVEFEKIILLDHGAYINYRFNTNNWNTANSKDFGCKMEDVVINIAEGNIFNSKTQYQCAMWNITCPSGVTSTKNVFRNNSVFSRANTNGLVSFGTETSTANNDKIQGIVLEENNGVFSGYENDVPLFFVGHNNNAIVRMNRSVDYQKLVVLKHSGAINSTGIVEYNLSINGAITVVGIEDLEIANNTVVVENETLLSTFVNITNNGFSAANMSSRNNIIVVQNKDVKQVFERVQDLTVMDIDYNLLYSVSGTETFQTVSAGVSTDLDRAAWQLLGFDTNSVFDNPKLMDDYSPYITSPAIGAGIDRGGSNNIGLDPTTDWGDETKVPIIVTKTQPASWDIGAFVVSE